MSALVPTIRVKPWSKDQGDFVEINEADFDPAVHQLLDAPAKADPFDHDGDGKPGGSVKGSRRKKA